MREIGSSRRFWSKVVLLLHMFVVGAAPLADAVLDTRARAFDYAHVESEDSPHCAPSHDHLFCQLCRVVDGRFSGGRIAPAWLDAQLTTQPAIASAAAAPSRPAPVSGVGSRAPPLV